MLLSESPDCNLTALGVAVFEDLCAGTVADELIQDITVGLSYLQAVLAKYDYFSLPTLANVCYLRLVAHLPN